MADVFCKKCYFGNETFTVKGVEFTMIAVEGGTFTMGATPEQGSDAEDWEKPTHQVTLSSYYIGETEVTQALWQEIERIDGEEFPLAYRGGMGICSPRWKQEQRL